MRTSTDTIHRWAWISCPGRRAAFLLELLALFVFTPFVALAQDADNDGYSDLFDNCPNFQNWSILDSDADGVGNDCDTTPFGESSPVGAINGMGLGVPGPRSCHILTLRRNDDTLPPGTPRYYVVGIFDTGATYLLLNQDTWQYLEIPNGVPFDVHLWGFAAVLPDTLYAPLDFPEAEISAVRVSAGPSGLKNLIGGPVTNEVVAYIDYRVSVDRGDYSCAAITFYPSDTSGIDPFPTPLFFTNLHPFGRTNPPPTNPTGPPPGQRYLIADMRLVNSVNGIEKVAESTTVEDYSGGPFRILYDTGNTTTQISTDVAQALGIDLANDTPETSTRVTAANALCDEKDSGGNSLGRPLNGYRISRLEIDASDGSYRYVVKNPLVFVPTHCPENAPSDILTGGVADVNLGTDLFGAAQVLFDGPGNRLGFYTGEVFNMPPVCDAGGPYTAECSASVTLDGSRSSDPDGDPDSLAYLWTGPFVEGAGMVPGKIAPVTFVRTGDFPVDLKVDDGVATDTCSADVTVEDTTPPILDVPPDLVQECTSSDGATVDIGSASASDSCDGSIHDIVNNHSSNLFSLGSTEVVWTATDDSGNSTSAVQTITIEDSTPPSLNVSVSPSVLWPPNHKMNNITATVTASDTCDASPTIELTSVTSNEPDNVLGDGDRANDIQGAAVGVDDRSFRLRAERSGTGVGRIYTVTYTATDAAGNASTKSATVTVPHDQ